MALIDPVLGVKIVFLLGITNIIGLLLILSSCRCIPMSNLIPNILKSNKYLKFYNSHCFYWLFFIASVILHVIFVYAVFGIPF